MRKILFRGKDIKGIWHIGLLAHIGNAWYISNKAGIATAFEVIPETVGQYTGLTDKNRTRIFEGDIVLWCGIKGIVVWEGHKFYIKSNLLWDFSDDDCIEVIGNIHDNPELLKEREGQ